MRTSHNLQKLLLTVILLLTARLAQAAAYNAVVAKDGSGQYTSVQAAIDAVPDGNHSVYKIFIKKGRYNEQIHIPASKPFITLIGENVSDTEIVYADGKGGTTTMTIDANDITVVNITLENTQGRLADGPQSLAVKTSGDRIAFFSCRFISGQDTVYVNKAGTRVYFKDCYIDGNTDFIYGSAIAVFDKCVIFPRDRVDYGKGGYVTAASTPVAQPYGLVFRDCIVPDNHGITHYSLGRPWQNDATVVPKGRTRAGNKTVFLNTMFGGSIIPTRWTVWDAGTETEQMIYAEYHSTDLSGKKLDISGRVSWSKDLSDAEAQPYTIDQNLLGDWKPLALWSDAGSDKAPVTITNFTPRYKTDQVQLQFNSSWPAAGVTFTLYKGEEKQTLKEIAHKTSGSGNTVAYQFEDELPSAGHTFYYLLKATKGKRTVLSDTIAVDLDKMPKGKTKK